jgi:hypothetical protein
MSALNEIEKLVNEVAKAALEKRETGIDFRDRVDALKVLTPYFLALRKDTVDSELDGETMADFARTLKEPTHGQIRSRRGNGRNTGPASGAE